MSDAQDVLKKLLDYLEKAEDFTLPSYKELPSVDLYMEQVLKYVNSSLTPLYGDEKLLTSFMVNNYVKAKLISEPVKKKYSKDQIGYLIAITMMKSTVTMADMSVLLDFEKSVSDDKSALYRFWSSLESEILNEASADLVKKVEKIESIYQKEKGNRPEAADSLAFDRLAFYALRLSIEAQANKLLSQAIIASIREGMYGEEAKEETSTSKAELKQEGIVGEIEASKLAQSKQKRVKKAAKKNKKTSKTNTKKPAKAE